MVKHSVRVALVAVLVAVAWTVGRAQTTATDFELVLIKEPGGMDLQVQCVRGCNLAMRQHYGPALDPKKAQRDVGFACDNENRCEVFVAGWVQR